MAVKETTQSKAPPKGCEVRQCPGCKPHPFQDKQYGNKNRVQNRSRDGFTCTVCGTVNK